MAVLVEAISVVIRRDAIDHSFTGGWNRFRSCVPNATLCTDSQLARVGFMDPEAVRNFMDTLEGAGLTFLRDGKCADFVVVDQYQGPTRPCEWLQLARVRFGNSGGKVAICWLFDEPREAADLPFPDFPGLGMEGMDIATPKGWVFEGSLSEHSIFVPNEEVTTRLRFLRTENQTDVFLDTATEREIYKPASRRSHVDGGGTRKNRFSAEVARRHLDALNRELGPRIGELTGREYFEALKAKYGPEEAEDILRAVGIRGYTSKETGVVLFEGTPNP